VAASVLTELSSESRFANRVCGLSISTRVARGAYNIDGLPGLSVRLCRSEAAAVL